MFTYGGDATIALPAHEVFAFVAAPENLPRWSDVSYVEKLTDGPMGLGTRVKMTMGQGPMRATSEFEVSEWEDDRTLTFKTVPPHWLLWDATYRVEAVGPSSSRITTNGQITLSGIRRVLEPVIRNELSKGEQGELDRLKAILEERPA